MEYSGGKITDLRHVRVIVHSSWQKCDCDRPRITSCWKCANVAIHECRSFGIWYFHGTVQHSGYKVILFVIARCLTTSVAWTALLMKKLDKTAFVSQSEFSSFLLFVFSNCIAGFLSHVEQSIIEGFHIPYNKFFIPLAWAVSLTAQCLKEGLIKSDHGHIKIIQVRPTRSSSACIEMHASRSWVYVTSMRWSENY